MKNVVLTISIFCFFSVAYASETFYFLENGTRIDLKRVKIKHEWPVVLSGDRTLYLTGEITAKTKGGDKLSAIKREIKDSRSEISSVLCNNEICYTTFRIPYGSDPFDITDKIHKTGVAAWIQPDWKIKIRTTSISNDPYVDRQWHLPMINADKGWNYTHGEPYSIIAVLDTGISIYHPDIKENIVKGKSFAKDLSSGVSPLEDAKGPYNNMVAAHGTAVAGIIGAVTDNGEGAAGICGNCSVMPGKFFDYHEESISVSRVLQAFKWLVDNGAAVINNSWGEIDVDESGKCLTIQQDNYRMEAVNYAKKYGRKGLGTVVVWAAGNSGCDTALNMNNNNSSILLTASVDKSGKKTSYTNYGDRIDIALPDASFTTDIPGEPGFNDSVYHDFDDLDYTNSLTGTSASAAVASGIAGLIISINPSLTSDEVIKCIKMAATLPDSNCYLGESERELLNIDSDPDQEHSKCYGFGIVDVEKALKMAKDGTCGEPYAGCSKNDECPLHFKCDTTVNQCIENISDPLPRYKRDSSRGCSLLFME